MVGAGPGTMDSPGADAARAAAAAPAAAPAAAAASEGFAAPPALGAGASPGPEPAGAQITHPLSIPPKTHSWPACRVLAEQGLVQVAHDRCAMKHNIYVLIQCNSDAQTATGESLKEICT